MRSAEHLNLGHGNGGDVVGHDQLHDAVDGRDGVGLASLHVHPGWRIDESEARQLDVELAGAVRDGVDRHRGGVHHVLLFG